MLVEVELYKHVRFIICDIESADNCAVLFIDADAAHSAVLTELFEGLCLLRTELLLVFFKPKVENGL